MTDLDTELCNRTNEIGRFIWTHVKDPEERLSLCLTLATLLAFHPIAKKEEDPVEYMRMVDGVLALMRKNAILLWTQVRKVRG